MQILLLSERSFRLRFRFRLGTLGSEREGISDLTESSLKDFKSRFFFLQLQPQCLQYSCINSCMNLSDCPKAGSSHLRSLCRCTTALKISQLHYKSSNFPYRICSNPYNSNCFQQSSSTSCIEIALAFSKSGNSSQSSKLIMMSSSIIFFNFAILRKWMTSKASRASLLQIFSSNPYKQESTPVNIAVYIKADLTFNQSGACKHPSPSQSSKTCRLTCLKMTARCTAKKVSL